MFELSSETSVFFQHYLKYIGTGVAHTAYHISQTLPSTSAFSCY